MLSSELEIPALALLVLIGVSQAERAAFAARHFAPEEVCLSLNAARERLSRGRLAALNLPTVHPAERAAAVLLAHEQDVAAAAVVLDLPDPSRPDEVAALRQGLGGPDSPALRVEGFAASFRLRSAAELASVRLRRVRLKVDRRDLHGPFDIIGDVHGCLPELLELLERLGYAVDAGLNVNPPPGRTAVFLGDLVDRGPDTPGVLRLVMGMVAAGSGLCVCGNHDAKLKRALAGQKVTRTHGLEITFEQLAAYPPEFSQAVREVLSSLPSHLLLDGGRLVAAHAGLPERFHGRDSGRVRAFALYGDVGRTLDEHGLPLRRDWAADYHGAALVAYGHTPVVRPRWKHRSVNLDTGCVFGGALSGLRYPELETYSVAAQSVYREASRPLLDFPGEQEEGGPNQR
ncbi:metallophosphoesterase [Deinococcus sp.]|uniref:metallophosphoesterase n=1 Tax=Deinococcus sp. TaxID=47478 RepID=UPI003CC68BFD